LLPVAREHITDGVHVRRIPRAPRLAISYRKVSRLSLRRSAREEIDAQKCGTQCPEWIAPSRLTARADRSTFVLMEVETLGVARSLDWKVHMRCANGYRQETRSMRKCVYRKHLDLETLVATGGPNFPLSRLESGLMCPACRNRRVTVVFEPPSNAQVGTG
jgi:hypothetical protein